MNTLGETSTDQLDFVTLDGLLSYGEELAQRMPGNGITLPPAPPPSRRSEQADKAMDAVRSFVRRAQSGFPAAADYRAARGKLIAEDCGGDEVLFYAAWNVLLAQGELAPLYRAPIGSVQKPVHRRPVAIVPRAQLTPQLAEGRIVLTVADHGPGIPDEARERVFERFHSLRPDDEDFGHHSGLGLAIARTIVEAHEGTLTVRDRSDGGSGAVLAIDLPCLAPR